MHKFQMNPRTRAQLAAMATHASEFELESFFFCFLIVADKQAGFVVQTSDTDFSLL